MPEFRPLVNERWLAFKQPTQRIDVSIEQCRAWTLENNLDLHVAMVDPEIAATLINEEEAAFERTLAPKVGGLDHLLDAEAYEALISKAH